MSDSQGKEKKANPFKMFLNGGFGGVCTVVTGHPFDTIKVRLQTMPRPESGQPPMYAGTWDCAMKTIRSEGFAGLYKGMSAPLATIAPIFATCFFGYALGTRLQQKEGQLKLTYPQIFVAGIFSGLFTTLIVAPGERVKCLLQVQKSTGGEQKYKGMTDTIVKLYKEGGIQSVFKGTCATMLRDLPANGIYFVTYEFLQNEIKRRTNDPNVGILSAIFSGGMAGVSYWVLGMPADVLKSRLQTAPVGTYKHGIRSVFADLIKKDGPFALYRGVSPVMIRAFPANAACFFGIEVANAFFASIAPNF